MPNAKSRIGILSTAHLHVWSYASAVQNHPDAILVGAWDDAAARLEAFCKESNTQLFSSQDDLLDNCDAVIITSENVRHADLAEAAAEKGKHILCEKPLVISEEQAAKMLEIANKVKLMTAFPCRFSPAFPRLKQRVEAGDIGKIKGICATNRGKCPFGWFVEKDKSGGGSMIDHVVHVADLLRALLDEEVSSVYAQIGNNIYGHDWEDTAMLTLQFPSGIFATLDSSWSRPQSYKTWGDVTMNVVGEGGVIEMDMFAQAIDVYSDDKHALAGYGTNIDSALFDAFIRCVLDDTDPPVTALDGIKAARVALAGYESVRLGKPVALSSG